MVGPGKVQRKCDRLAAHVPDCLIRLPRRSRKRIYPQLPTPARACPRATHILTPSIMYACREENRQIPL
jgi:hypothetical protein